MSPLLDKLLTVAVGLWTFGALLPYLIFALFLFGALTLWVLAVVSDVISRRRLRGPK